MSNLTVVVAGIPALSTALENSGRFGRVVAVESTAGLKRLLQSGTLSSGVDDKVFMFADTTPVDTPQTLAFLVGKLTAMGTPVVIVATTPGARDLVAQCPGAGLLEGPLKLNQVLGALSGLPKLPPLEPVADNVSIPLPGIEPEPTVPASPFGVAAPPPQTASAVPAFPAAANPFAPPAAEATPAVASAPAFPAPAFGQQAAPAFGQPAQAAAPAFGQPAPAAEAAVETAPARRRSLSEVAAGQDSAVPGAVTPVASPFATPAPEAAPAFGQSAPAPAVAPAFGQPTPEAPAGFGGQPAGAPAFGQPAGAPAFGQPAGAPAFGQPAPEAPVGFGGQPAAAPAFGQPAPEAPVGWAAQQTPAVAAPMMRAGAPVPTERPARRGLVITVTAPKGGTGKSTLSLNLAAYLGLRLRGTGKNVCIIDANVQQADTGKYLNAYTPNIEGILKDVTAIHPDRINNYLLHKPELNLSALLGPATPEVANPLYFTGRRYTQILEALKPNFDYIIIDTPVAELYHDIFREFALPQADFIATTIAPNVATLLNTDSWLRQITAPRNADGMGIDREKIGIVLNRAQEDIGLSEEEVRRELGEWRFLGSIPETKEWQRCNNRGELVATKNYHELNEAFSIVLAAATGEELLSTTPASLTQQKGPGALSGLLGRLRGKKG